MSQHLITTQAQPNTCHRCQQPTLTGYAEGLTAHVDPTPLPDSQAEITALLNGLHTYNRLLNGQLVYRDAMRIRDPYLRKRDIHIEHKCTRPTQGVLF